jgi:protein TonB
MAIPGRRRWTFSIYHGLAASLVLHSAFGLPLVVHGFMSPPDEPEMLVIELKGLVAEVQTAEQTAGDTPENVTPQQAQPQQQALAAPAAPAPPPQEEAVVEDKVALPVPADSAPPPQLATEPAPAIPAAPQAAGAAEQMELQQTIRRDLDRDRFNAYVKLLTKKVQANLVYPDEGRRSGLHGAATISFTIRGDGQIRLESLKIVESSGQHALDTSALQTIRASVPFEPPPREITVSIAVAFGRKS